jgi:hypothetical protein
VPRGTAAEENRASATAIARSPRAALRRYALAYTNWRAGELPVRERELVKLGVGPARLAAEQTAASASAIASLTASHVENQGVVLTIAPGEGAAGGQWIVVTQEQTSGTGAYAGLPPAPHVTVARVTRVGQGWAVSEWSPRS